MAALGYALYVCFGICKKVYEDLAAKHIVDSTRGKETRGSTIDQTVVQPALAVECECGLQGGKLAVRPSSGIKRVVIGAVVAAAVVQLLRWSRK